MTWLLLLALAVTIAHPARGQAYHLFNSIRGIRRAARRGFKRIDLDLCITRDGVIVVNHWPRPMLHDGFYDPLGQIARRAAVHTLLWRQVRRLRTRRLYRISTLRRCLQACARHGITAVIEPKGDSRFTDPDTWARIDAMRAETGAQVEVRVLAQNNPDGAVVRAASKYFKAWEIAA